MFCKSMVVFEEELGSEIRYGSCWYLYLGHLVHSLTSCCTAAEQDISVLVYVYCILQLLWWISLTTKSCKQKLSERSKDLWLGKPRCLNYGDISLNCSNLPLTFRSKQEYLTNTTSAHYFLCLRLLHSTAEKCATETHSIGANEKENRTAPLVPLKKLYCFTCATEKNEWAPLKELGCSSGTAEKCSAGASETAVLALLKEKKSNWWRNQQVPLKESDCFNWCCWKMLCWRPWNSCVCAHCDTCLKDWWAQQWDWHPSVLQVGATSLDRWNFMVTTIFNFHNLKKWVVCTNCGTQTDGHNNGISAHPSFRQAPQFSTALLLLYLIFITWRSGHVPQFWTSWILWLLLYLIFIIWRNGLYVLLVAPIGLSGRLCNFEQVKFYCYYCI